jgi:multidrug transporter EmrE-like cation transporter
MMLICFLTNGLGAFGLRIMTGMGLTRVFTVPYLMLWYWSGFILAAIVFFSQHRRFHLREVLIGAGLACSSIVGQFSMAFALDNGIPGFIVYQVAPGGGLFFVVLVGILFFKERVSGYGLAGIILGMSALAILTFG